MISFKEFLGEIVEAQNSSYDSSSVLDAIIEDADKVLEELKGRDCSCSTSNAHIEDKDIHPTIEELSRSINKTAYTTNKPRYPHDDQNYFSIYFEMGGKIILFELCTCFTSKVVLRAKIGNNSQIKIHLTDAERTFLRSRIEIFYAECRAAGKTKEAKLQAKSREVLDL